MKIAIVTGSSRGVGYELAKFLLKREYKVYGIARTSTNLSDEFPKEYTHIEFDLGEVKKIDDLISSLFSKTTDALTECLLINNAALLDPIGPCGKLSSQELLQSVNVNITSLMILTNAFIRTTQELAIDKRVIHISSGAAAYGIFGWSTYCSSKAAVEMFAKTVNIEQAEFKYPVKNYIVRPGIIDTKMQQQIREQSKSNFIDVDKFVSYHKEGQLKCPKLCAQEIYENSISRTPKQELISL